MLFQSFVRCTRNVFQDFPSRFRKSYTVAVLLKLQLISITLSQLMTASNYEQYNQLDFYTERQNLFSVFCILKFPNQEILFMNIGRINFIIQTGIYPCCTILKFLKFLNLVSLVRWCCILLWFSQSLMFFRSEFKLSINSL